MVTCDVLSDNSLLCNGTVYTVEAKMLTYMDTYFWVYLGVYVGLVLVAGLMSGLTMGMLSLDLTSLKVLREGGKPRERAYAARIVPLVEKHHFLLVTLVLANAAAVETMPLCLDRVSDPVTAILVSVTAVLMFGEVLPQALCTRYGLAIGAVLSPLVYILMVITFPVSFPLAKLLDCLLGEDTGTFYRRAELKVLVGIHGPQTITDNSHVCCNEEALTAEEVRVIRGTLEMHEKRVHHAMLPLDKVFMLDVDTVLNENMINQILSVGHSRIPIYEGTTQTIVGILLVKKMITLETRQEATTLRSLLSTRCVRPALKVYEADPLFDLLHKFKTGKSHLSIVCAPCYEDVPDTGTEWYLYQNNSEKVTGIITLEDVIEELILDEILDEKDVPDGLTRLKSVLRKTTIQDDVLRRHHSEYWSVNGSTLGSSCSVESPEVNERTSLLSKERFPNKSLPY